MSYVKAHPFGHKGRKSTATKEDMALSHANVPLAHKQTVTEVVEYKVARRVPMVTIRPNGKKKTEYVPVLDKKGNPTYDTFYRTETRVVCHYGREVKGRTLAMMVYETFPKPEMK